MLKTCDKFTADILEGYLNEFTTCLLNYIDWLHFCKILRSVGKCETKLALLFQKHSGKLNLFLPFIQFCIDYSCTRYFTSALVETKYLFKIYD